MPLKLGPPLPPDHPLFRGGWTVFIPPSKPSPSVKPEEKEEEPPKPKPSPPIRKER
jgi:hypothetical protein